MANSFYLLLPGLLQTKTLFKNHHILDKILSKAKMECVPNHITYSLNQLFNLNHHDDFPYAALSAFAQGLGANNKPWIYTDFINMTIGPKGPFIQNVIEVSKLEENLTDLQLLLQPIFDAVNAQLNFNKQSNLLSLTRFPDISTHMLLEVLMKPLLNKMPTGPESALWKRMLTESQMALSAYYSKKSLVIDDLKPNSLWFWGAGLLADEIDIPYDKVYGDTSFIKGAALLGKLAYCFNDEILEFDHDTIWSSFKLKTLFDLNKYTELESYYLWLNTHCLKPIWNALNSKKIKTLIIDTGEGKMFKYSPINQYYFWRKNHYVTHSND